MKIFVSGVPAEGMTDRATYDPAPMDMERLDIHLREPFVAEAFIRKVGQELVVKADIRCPLSLTCARCLEEFPSVVATQSILSYKVQPTDVVDITEDIRQEIILAYPMIPVCGAECKGLCRSCGQNLNVGACRHHLVP